MIYNFALNVHAGRFMGKLSIIAVVLSPFVNGIDGIRVLYRVY